MDTKEKNRRPDAETSGRTAVQNPEKVRRKRPASASEKAGKPAPRKAHRPEEARGQKPRTEAAAERPARQAPASAAAQRKAAPPERKKASARSFSRQKPAASDSQYKPYKKATNQKKAVRNRNFAKSVSRFFSYENPVVRFFTKTDPAVFGADPGSRQQRKAAAEAKKRKRAAELNTPAIIYTQPMTFNRNRLAVQLLTVLAVVLALVLGMSVFFKVKVITVSGAQVYSAWTIRENSGINVGDNLLTFGRTRASGQIIANLPYVKSARIGIKLPDTVNIEVEEEDVVYAIKDSDGVWWLMNSNGKVVEQTSNANAKNYTQVLGVTLYMPQPTMQGVATEAIPAETDGEGEPVPVVNSGAIQLNAALTILQALEANDIVGSAASVDVTRLEDIVLWYGTQYQVNLGNTERMEYKIACMNDVILQMSDYQTGILDITFNIWKTQVGYTPFA